VLKSGKRENASNPFSLPLLSVRRTCCYLKELYGKIRIQGLHLMLYFIPEFFQASGPVDTKS